MVDKKSSDIKRRRVKISNWHDHALANPKDIKHPKHVMESHNRIFGATGSIYEIPKTSTQELLGSIKNTKFYDNAVVRCLVNFMTYPLNDHRYNTIHPEMYSVPEVRYPPETTYEEKFKAPYGLVKEKNCCDEALDPLFNRIPKNDFEMLPQSTNKFMDDHLVMLSEGRKRINCLRQLRNASNPIN